MVQLSGDNNSNRDGVRVWWITVCSPSDLAFKFGAVALVQPHAWCWHHHTIQLATPICTIELREGFTFDSDPLRLVCT